MKFQNIGQRGFQKLPGKKKKNNNRSHTRKGLGVITAPTFSIAILGAKRHWDNHFKIPTENNVQLRILCPNAEAELSQSNAKAELRCFSKHWSIMDAFLGSH